MKFVKPIEYSFAATAPMVTYYKNYVVNWLCLVFGTQRRLLNSDGMDPG